MTKEPIRKVLFVGNSSWYLWNFRRDVMAAVVAEGWEVIAVAPGDEFSARLDGMAGVRWQEWPVALNDADPIDEAASFLGLLAIMHKERPAFAINHGAKANIYGGIACRLRSIPYVNSATGLGVLQLGKGVRPKLLARLYAFACNGAKTLFVQNEDDLDLLRGAGLSRRVSVVRTMGSGVDLAHFRFVPMPPSGERVFLFVGRLQRDKGIWDFVNAARGVKREFANTRFIAVGSRKFANRGRAPRDVLTEWTSEGVVEFPGRQEDVRPWLGIAHALVLPSHGGEGVPRAMLEAAAVGRPSIASNVPGCRDVVEPGKTGYLHSAGDVANLAEAMRKICSAGEDDLFAMGKAARKDAEERFSIDRVVEAVLRTLPH